MVQVGGFEVEAMALEVSEHRFDSHADGVEFIGLVRGGQVGGQEPGFGFAPAPSARTRSGRGYVGCSADETASSFCSVSDLTQAACAQYDSNAHFVLRTDPPAVTPYSALASLAPWVEAVKSWQNRYDTYR